MPSDRTIQIDIQKMEHLEKIYASLIVLQGVDIGRDYRIHKNEFKIGRDPDCQFSIPESYVSRNHAVIRLVYYPQKNSYEYTIMDLDSTNHTYVNNKQITTHRLKDGDKIQIGYTILKFVLQDAMDIKFHKDLQKLIKYDALTSLLTKESLYLALERELVRCRKYNIPLTILMMDLDHFKLVNDTYGHQTGSHVLKEIGAIIRNNLRKIDVSARYGGEEFLSYLVEQPKNIAMHAADRLRDMIENAVIMYKDNFVNITISIGVSQFPVDGTNIDDLVARADEALYRAKNNGRNLVVAA